MKEGKGLCIQTWKNKWGECGERHMGVQGTVPFFRFQNSQIKGLGENPYLKRQQSQCLSRALQSGGSGTRDTGIT